LGRHASNEAMFCFSKARCADSFRSSTAFSFGVRSSSYSCMSSCVCAERKPRPWNPAAFPFSTPNLGHDRRSTTAFGTFVVFFATRTVRTVLILCPASFVRNVVIVFTPFTSISDS
jgi:hypothetical protein